MSANPQPSNPQPSVAKSIGKYGPIVTIIVFIAMFAIIGYFAGNFLGSLLGAVDGQAASSSYLAANIVNSTTHDASAANVIQSQGAYYYLQSMTLPNTYSLAGLFLGALVGLLVAISYLEEKHS